MAKEIMTLKESLANVLVKYNEIMDSGDISPRQRQEIRDEFRKLEFNISMFMNKLNDIEEKEGSLIGKFEALSDEKKIPIIEAIRPELKIYPISYVNDYVKNELHGDCLKFMNSIEASDLSMNTEDATYFVVNHKTDIIMFDDDLDYYAIYENGFNTYLKNHPELFEK